MTEIRNIWVLRLLALALAILAWFFFAVQQRERLSDKVVEASVRYDNFPGLVLLERIESVRVGLNALDRSSTGVLICLSDHPVVTADTYRALMKEYRKEPDRIVVPRYVGKKGHPTLFPRKLVDKVCTGLNLREIQQRHSDRILFIQVEDEGVITDVDTMDDYQRLLLKYQDL